MASQGIPASQWLAQQARAGNRTAQQQLSIDAGGRPYQDVLAASGPSRSLHQAALVNDLMSPATQAAAQPVEAPDFTKVGQYADQLQGYDLGKLNDPTHNTPKYQEARVFSNFDLRNSGVTPELLAALNGLNIGTYSGSGDKLTLTNADPRFGTLYNPTRDIVTNFSGGDPSSRFVTSGLTAATTPGGQAAVNAGGRGGWMNPGATLVSQALNRQQSSDTMSRIQQAIQALAGGNSTKNALLAQLQGV